MIGRSFGAALHHLLKLPARRGYAGPQRYRQEPEEWQVVGEVHAARVGTYAP
jgi:hypothetical protein